MENRFRERLRSERERRGLSQADLAKQVKSRGVLSVYPSTVAKIEAGERSVKIDEASAIADVFGMSVDALLGRKASPASDVASILAGLQHASGKAVLDLAAMQAVIQGWFAELGDVVFTSRDELDKLGKRSLDALSAAQSALYAIGQVEAPQRVALSKSKIDALVDRKAHEKLVELLKGESDEA